VPIHAAGSTRSSSTSRSSTQGAHPNDFASLDELAERLLAFAEHYRQIARPFGWNFTRTHLDRVRARITTTNPTSGSPPNDQNFCTRLLDPKTPARLAQEKPLRPGTVLTALVLKRGS